LSRDQPLRYIWWLVSDAAGIVALVLVSLSVLLGLAMAAGVLRRSGVRRACARLHEHAALVALGAMGIHGLALLGDGWLRPGLAGVTIPFTLHYRPLFTGIGIVGGYLAALLGPSFYVRRRIGARRWRSVHRATVLVWMASVVHALGAGSDGSRLWLRVMVLAPLAPIVYLLVVRILGAATNRSPELRARPGRRLPNFDQHRQDRSSDVTPADAQTERRTTVLTGRLPAS
jgi:sulfoxide reductase heme-binding subunit YedZ